MGLFWNKQKLWRVLEPSVQYLFPNLCLHCVAVERVDEYLCEACRKLAFPQSRRGYSPQDGVLCLHRLNPVLRSLIHALKYQGMIGVASYLVQAAGDDVWDHPVMQPIGKWSWIPVPVHSARLRERGYNQAEKVARAFQNKVGGVVYPGILRRARYSVSQTKLEADQRRWNIAGAFVARPPAPDSVMLVDDVFTTGSTTASCVSALEYAGVKTIRIVTLAYEPKRSGQDDWILDRDYWEL